MITPGIFSHLSPFKKIILLTLIALLSMLAIMSIGWLIAGLLFDDFLFVLTNMTDFENDQVIDLLKYFQVLNQIGLFVIPPLIFAYLVGGNVKSYLKLDLNPGLGIVALSTLMIFAALPLVHWSAGINELIHFPDWMKGLEEWLKQSEEDLQQLSYAFLKTTSIGGFLFNLLMIAVLPAIGEELLFRGVLQKVFHQWFKNIHWAILITAIIFSAMHLQFYGFLPRTILGIMFGYLFVITKSLWVPILVHFFNNAAAVLSAYLFRKDLLETDYQEIGQFSEPIWVIGSVITVLLLFLAIHRLSEKRGEVR
ncbi:MAG: CPBP family intramembrane metalloprotease [Bacteroidales bacterium]|nr:CPBP family intramembrane metalloprotease [Bacteroidales bacterium]